MKIIEIEIEIYRECFAVELAILLTIFVLILYDFTWACHVWTRLWLHWMGYYLEILYYKLLEDGTKGTFRGGNREQIFYLPDASILLRPLRPYRIVIYDMTTLENCSFIKASLTEVFLHKEYSLTRTKRNRKKRGKHF
ncbi:hypothetical protein ACJX0J_007151, partial [Zea mays]